MFSRLDICWCKTSSTCNVLVDDTLSVAGEPTAPGSPSLFFIFPVNHFFIDPMASVNIWLAGNKRDEMVLILELCVDIASEKLEAAVADSSVHYQDGLMRLRS